MCAPFLRGTGDAARLYRLTEGLYPAGFPALACHRNPPVPILPVRFFRMEARRMVSSRSCPPGNVQVCLAMVFASSWGRFLRTNGIAHQPLSYRCREMVILDACLGGFPLMIQSVPLHAFGLYMRQCPTLQHSHCCPVEDKGGRTVKLTQNGNQGDRSWESVGSAMGIREIGHGNQWDRS